MFKDPSHHGLPQTGSTREQSLSNGSSKVKKTNSIRTRDSNSGSASTNSTQSPVTLKSIKTRLKFAASYEDEVLNLIASSFQKWGAFPTDLPLSSAHIFSHCIIHSCLNFTAEQKGKLLEKIFSQLLTTVKVSCETCCDFLLPENNLCY